MLRWTYGPALGIAYGALRSRFRMPALAFGAALATAELLAMPRLGATPPVRGKEAIALFLHAAAFAVVAEAALAQAERSASRSAAIVRSISSVPCSLERKAASNWLGGR